MCERQRLASTLLLDQNQLALGECLQLTRDCFQQHGLHLPSGELQAHLHLLLDNSAVINAQLLALLDAERRLGQG